MSLNKVHARQLLARGDLRSLFIEDLGWDRHNATLHITLAGTSFLLQALAQKRGMVAYHCLTPVGQRLPDHPLRKKIEHQVAKSAHEHLIVFTDAKNETQIWQWVKREPGKPAACREHTFHRLQPGDALLQKLEAIAFSIEEEERLSLTDVTSRTRTGFDVERVTKRFYELFQKEHAAFLKLISGITETADREWYVSVLLNRLMFVYFIQRKGFLDGDRHYLRNRLTQMRSEHGKDKFYSFYRHFLLRLFHEGLGARKRSADLDKLVGRIPYLDGGLFDIHELEKPERYGKTIEIPDRAFERIFGYFDQYQWHLDERPLRADNEINPDVLGYIFEKYINQKQMGAYYTKEDITEYISKTTVVPFLLDAARSKCRIAFENAAGPTVWDLLKDDPDRYIYSAVRHGATEPLPDEIAIGLNPPSLQKPVGDGPVRTLEIRKGWNKPAPSKYSLPTETWREVVARRSRYEQIRAKLAGGEVRDMNDLITLNLDIRQFAQDVVENSEGPELLRALWHAVEKVTILDPTCGSGAFLFAALNILEPLYEACLERMEAFVQDLELSSEKHRPEKFSDFRKILDRVAAHPNRLYFIFKSIILNNLFGVDIMEEAVEICKLRLFLKLVAQVEPDTTQDNLGVEPLPDIDFNIRVGNTLVGYATFDDVKRAVTSKLDFGNAMETISVTAADLQQAFDAFRARQIQGDGSVPADDKRELHRRLGALDDELNRYLASQYDEQPSTQEAYARWLSSHQPFHWFVEFYGIMTGGGFDVIIGNPPWKEYSTVRSIYSVRGYTTEPSGNLYAMCIERSMTLLSPGAFLSFIVQLPLVSSSRMNTVREYMRHNASFIAAMTCDDRPGKLFDGLQHCRSTIFVLQRKARKNDTTECRLSTSGYRRWATSVRDSLFDTTNFTYVNESDKSDGKAPFPKFAAPLQRSVHERVFAHPHRAIGLSTVGSPTASFVFYQESAQYWVKATAGVPYYAKNGRVSAPAHGRSLFFTDQRLARTVAALLNSSLFYSYFITHGDCFHVSDSLATGLPIPGLLLEDEALQSLGAKLMKDLERNADRKTITTRDGDEICYDEFRVGKSKPILDDIDTVLAGHYGFTEQELDYVINYDIKYRMGLDTETEDE